MHTLGINIGSSNVKAVLLDVDAIQWSEVVPHEGNFIEALKKILSAKDLPGTICALATGTEGRHLLNLPSVIEPLCIEEAMRSMDGNVDAVVSMGGEDLVVYTVDRDNRIITSFSGNKCASGTGEFFRQQLGRMDMSLEDVDRIPADSRVLKLSTRCSVFMKSDCTHRLNKGEATRGDIVLSLCNVMAIKVSDFLTKARITEGRIALTGGVTRNPHLLGLLREKMPRLDILVPVQAPFFEAYGAALLARSSGKPLPSLNHIARPHSIKFDRFKNLNAAAGRVKFLPSKKGKVKPGREYLLGVDGGSTTTKACLVDMETSEITASFYGRTHGDPVGSLKKCLEEMKAQIRDDIGDAEIVISQAATTGSSREILGVFLETPAVYNEIIAHSVGTTFYQGNVDTIFEIGGQDAKYVLLKNRVPIDYAMNEACSAGTGSFLEESCRGDLNIEHAWEIGDIALKAMEPLKFGEHCSAFINSDIRKAVQQGASREDITAGLVTSIVSNYLNRVVGNRTIGSHIVLQGGVALNRALPLAFSLLLNKDIIVPPDPELMGCFGVALLVREKMQEGLIGKSSYRLDGILSTEISYEKEFTCRGCDNYCPIRVLRVNEHRYMFGGRCNKYANMRKKKSIDESGIADFIQIRNDLLFGGCVPDPGTLSLKSDLKILVPRCFSVYSLWPFYSWFFHELGVRAELTREVSPEGVARVESGYCFPAEIAHGAVQTALDAGFDYIFLPHFRDLESYEQEAPAGFCPITQALPYYIRQAFPEIGPEKILAPVVSFKYGKDKALESFTAMGKTLGFTGAESRAAFENALRRQIEYEEKSMALGESALEHARKSGKPVIAVLGRPYNAFTQDANMGIPRKFTSRGYTVIPFDILPFREKEIFPNMYWYYGQQNMKTGVLLKNEPNVFVTYISNFSCAPDSFMLHYLKWIMGTKPFLILEMDSHTADAGVDTRVEAFLDIIDGFRARYEELGGERYDNGLRFMVGDDLYVVNHATGERIPVRHNPSVKLLLANMGRLGAELLAASLRSAGISTVAMPLADAATVQMARNYASGKECLPSHLVLGSALRYFASDNYRKDELYLLFVPSTTGPCRTGQYFVFFENLFRDLRLENVVVVTLNSDNSYNELGPVFSKHAWWGLCISDYMKDVETVLRACAADPVKAMARYDELWHELVAVAEKDVTGVLPALKRIAREIAKIPLKRRPGECPKVLIVGEIYVRRDDFAVDELVQHFSGRGIIAKVSGITEWIYYCDHTRRHELVKKLRLLPWFRRVFSGSFRELIGWHIEAAYKHRVEDRIKSALGITGLLPDTPHNMIRIMDNAEKYFVTDELHSEISVSSGVAATAMMNGYSGIVNIAPFACLIGRVIEGLITPWARNRRYPVMSVEIDGNLLPPNIVSKLEIFMLNVLRFRDNPDIGEMIETGSGEQALLSRKIMKE